MGDLSYARNLCRDLQHTYHHTRSSSCIVPTGLLFNHGVPQLPRRGLAKGQDIIPGIDLGFRKDFRLNREVSPFCAHSGAVRRVVKRIDTAFGICDACD